MDSQKKKINLTLIRELFGLMAIMKFKSNGPYNQFKNEKKHLIQLFSAHTKIVDLVNSFEFAPETTLDIKSENNNLMSKFYFFF